MVSIYQYVSRALIAVSGYILFTTIVGALHARIAKKMGDATAVYDGMGEFNPWSHFDIIGFILCMITSFGWKKRLTLSIDTLCNLSKKIKIALVEPVLYTICSFIMCCFFVIMSHSSSFDFLLQDSIAIKAFLPGHVHFCVLLAYAFFNFAVICMAFAVMSLFSTGIDIIMEHFNGMQFMCSNVKTISLGKRVLIALPFIIVPLFFEPLLSSLYKVSYYCMKLFMVLH